MLFLLMAASFAAATDTTAPDDLIVAGEATEIDRLVYRVTQPDEIPLQPREVDSLSCDDAWYLASVVLAKHGYTFEGPMAERIHNDVSFTQVPGVELKPFGEYLSPEDMWNLDQLEEAQMRECGEIRSPQSPTATDLPPPVIVADTVPAIIPDRELIADPGDLYEETFGEGSYGPVDKEALTAPIVTIAGTGKDVEILGDPPEPETGRLVLITKDNVLARADLVCPGTTYMLFSEGEMEVPAGICSLNVTFIDSGEVVEFGDVEIFPNHYSAIECDEEFANCLWRANWIRPEDRAVTRTAEQPMVKHGLEPIVEACEPEIIEKTVEVPAQCPDNDILHDDEDQLLIDIAELEERNENLVDANVKLQSENTQLQAQVKELESAEPTVVMAEPEIIEREVVVEKTVDNPLLARELRELESHNSELVDEKEELLALNKQLAGDNVLLEDENDQLRAQVAELESAEPTVVQERVEVQTEVQDPLMVRENETLKKENANLQGRNNDLVAQNRELFEENVDLHAQVQGLEEQVENTEPIVVEKEVIVEVDNGFPVLEDTTCEDAIALVEADTNAALAQIEQLESELAVFKVEQSTPEAIVVQEVVVAEKQEQEQTDEPSELTKVQQRVVEHKSVTDTQLSVLTCDELDTLEPMLWDAYGTESGDQSVDLTPGDHLNLLRIPRTQATKGCLTQT